MKRVISLVLALIISLSVFSICSFAEVAAGDEIQGDSLKLYDVTKDNVFEKLSNFENKFQSKVITHIYFFSDDVPMEDKITDISEILSFTNEHSSVDAITISGFAISGFTKEFTSYRAFETYNNIDWLRICDNAVSLDLSNIDVLPNMTQLQLFEDTVESFYGLSKLKKLATLMVRDSIINDYSGLDDTNLRSASFVRDKIYDLSFLAKIKNKPTALYLSSNRISDASALGSTDNNHQYRCIDLSNNYIDSVYDFENVYFDGKESRPLDINRNLIPGNISKLDENAGYLLYRLGLNYVNSFGVRTDKPISTGDKLLSVKKLRCDIRNENEVIAVKANTNSDNIVIYKALNDGSGEIKINTAGTPIKESKSGYYILKYSDYVNAGGIFTTEATIGGTTYPIEFNMPWKNFSEDSVIATNTDEVYVDRMNKVITLWAKDGADSVDLYKTDKLKKFNIDIPQADGIEDISSAKVRISRDEQCDSISKKEYNVTVNGEVYNLNVYFKKLTPINCINAVNGTVEMANDGTQDYILVKQTPGTSLMGLNVNSSNGATLELDAERTTGRVTEYSKGGKLLQYKIYEKYNRSLAPIETYGKITLADGTIFDNVKIVIRFDKKTLSNSLFNTKNTATAVYDNAKDKVTFTAAPGSRIRINKKVSNGLTVAIENASELGNVVETANYYYIYRTVSGVFDFNFIVKDASQTLEYSEKIPAVVLFTDHSIVDEALGKIAEYKPFISWINVTRGDVQLRNSTMFFTVVKGKSKISFPKTIPICNEKIEIETDGKNIIYDEATDMYTISTGLISKNGGYIKMVISGVIYSAVIERATA